MNIHIIPVDCLVDSITSGSKKVFLLIRAYSGAVEFSEIIYTIDFLKWHSVFK